MVGPLRLSISFNLWSRFSYVYFFSSLSLSVHSVPGPRPPVTPQAHQALCCLRAFAPLTSLLRRKASISEEGRLLSQTYLWLTSSLPSYFCLNITFSSHPITNIPLYYSFPLYPALQLNNNAVRLQGKNGQKNWKALHKRRFMGDKHMKRCSGSLVIREISVEMPQWDITTCPLTWLKLKKTDHTRC